MKQSISRVVILFAALVSLESLTAQTEVHPILQEGITPARQISFDIQPFGIEDSHFVTLVSLEGLSLTLINQDHTLLLVDGKTEYRFPSSLDGWHRLDVIKRYFSQDIEVSIDGFPAFLSFPSTALDMFLPEDQLGLSGGMGTGGPVLGSLSLRNLDMEPGSLLDVVHLSGPRLDSKPGRSGVDSAASLSTALESISDPAPSPKAPADTPTDLEKEASPEAEEENSSQLFTPLF